MREDSYPGWICSKCAREAGKTWPEGLLSTFHNGICGWCNQKTGVSSPRNWGWPELKKTPSQSREGEEEEQQSSIKS